MVPKVKKRLKRITFLLIVSLVLLKVGLEIDNYFYESKLMKVNDKTQIHQDSLNTVQKTVVCNGAAIHYFITGNSEKPTILFLHPAFSDHTAFDNQIEYFVKNYSVICIDVLAHGFSKTKNTKDKIDKTDQHILEILKKEKIEKVHLVGVSMGALLAQYFAWKYPKQVLSVTALGGYDIHEDNKEVQKAQRSVNIGLIFRAVFSMKSFRQKVSEMTCCTPKGKALFYYSTKEFTRGSFSTMQGLTVVTQKREVPPVKYPILVLTGEHDIPLAHKMALRWHEKLKGSKYVEIKGAGHCAQLDKPLLFNDLLSKFLSEIK